ncbi:MAG: hypothetical protein ACOX7X_00270 [Methanosarcina flavescens]|uniref:hypothetical protein n=1 Tax=Methanosarcina flavescens TaxID=1715806 RepID=UPI001435671C|nr:hypothetical protein [Methanosarcina flavescens]
MNSSFDRITAAQVVQYLTPEQIDAFVNNACSHLNGGGKIIFFDISGFYCSDLIANILREDCKKYVS